MTEATPTECLFVSHSAPLEGEEGKIQEKLLRNDRNTTRKHNP